MGFNRRITRHRKSISSPGIIVGKRVTFSFDSIEEMQNHDNHVFIWSGINESLKKNQGSELESEVINDGSVDSERLTERKEGVNGEDQDDHPIFSSRNPPSFNSSLTSNLPSSSSNSLPSSSDISSPLPSPSSSNSSYDPKLVVLKDKLFEPKESKNGFEDLTIQIPEQKQETYVAHLRAIMPPPIQVMGRSGGGYDPQRIPSAVFETNRSSTPIEWSAASNESLFSLNLGSSNSLAAEKVLAWGEMIKAGEAENRPSAISTADTDYVNSILVEESYESNIELELNKHEKNGLYDGDEKSGENRVGDESNKDELRGIHKDIKDEKHTYNSVPSLKYQDLTVAASIKTKASDGSGDSSSSFAFPVRKKGACWPSYFFASICSWVFCYRQNRRFCCGFCHPSTNVLADGSKTIDHTYSLAATSVIQSPQSPQPPQLPIVAPGPTKAAASRSCFNCSYWLCCCCYLFRSCSCHPCSNCQCHNITCSSCCWSSHSSSCFRQCSCPHMCSRPSCFRQCSNPCLCSCCSCFRQFNRRSCYQCSCCSCFCSYSTCHRWSCSCFSCSSHCLRSR